MSEARGGNGVATAPKAGPGLFVTTLLLISAASALTFAVIGWWWELPATGEIRDKVVDVATRSVKVLFLSDIYEAPTQNSSAAPLLRVARVLGVLTSLLFAARLFLVDYGAWISRVFFASASRHHDVIVGTGAASKEYAQWRRGTRRRTIHLADRWGLLSGNLATFERAGPLKKQLDLARASRARRIVVDEGDDADTWQSAQAIARECPKAEVLAHITDPWMRDRLSRDMPTLKLMPFSYAGGAARQVMLAHPPYLLANRLGAPAQHILIIGFGQLGQSLAREFIATSHIPDDGPMMVTIVDPEAAAQEADFESRHPELVKHVDFEFFTGDFRLNNPALLEQLKARSAKAGICAAYVAIDLESRPLVLAYALRAMALQHGLFAGPIFVCAQHGAGLPPARDGAGYVGGAPEEQPKRERDALQDGRLSNLRVVSFGSWPEAFDGAGLLEAEYDSQARRFHREYERLRMEQARAKDPGAPPPASEPWEVLPDQLRVSNRRVAAHMRAKAYAAGFDLGKWLDSRNGGWSAHNLPPAAANFLIGDPNFMLKMAKLEHQRWVLERFLDGWRPGPRDNYKRQRPDLIPFEQLGPGTAHKDDEVTKTTKALMEASGGQAKP